MSLANAPVASPPASASDSADEGLAVRPRFSSASLANAPVASPPTSASDSADEGLAVRPLVRELGERACGEQRLGQRDEGLAVRPGSRP